MKKYTITLIDGVLASYKNGNYNVLLYTDGTKVRTCYGSETPKPAFPENIDIKITNRCKFNCPFCHENSTIDGEHGDLHSPVLDTLKPGTELAIGGGDIMLHPGLEEFLNRMSDRGVICNITINMHDLLYRDNAAKIRQWCEHGLVHGVGVSWDGISPIGEKVYEKLYGCEHNIVIHTIAGVHDLAKLKLRVPRYCSDVKVLVLGYKTLRRGKEYKEINGTAIAKQLDKLKEDIKTAIDEDWFDVLSFDNLAIDQLNLDKLVDKAVWDESYMGEEGSFTMYIDLPNQEYAMSSTSAERIKFGFFDDIEDVFKKVKTNDN